MSNKMMVTLDEDENEALFILAERERREPNRQAALCIRRELERQGYLKVTDQCIGPSEFKEA